MPGTLRKSRTSSPTDPAVNLALLARAHQEEARAAELLFGVDVLTKLAGVSVMLRQDLAQGRKAGICLFQRDRDVALSFQGGSLLLSVLDAKLFEDGLGSPGET